MKRYRGSDLRKVDVVDQKAVGSCESTRGMTCVIYKYDTEDFHRIMEHREFHKEFTEVENYNRNG